MSLVSSGAINGDAINAVAIDGGLQQLVATAAAGLTVSGATAPVRRANLVGASGAIVSGALSAVRRACLTGAAALSVGGALAGSRRARAIAASGFAVDAALRAIRRTQTSAAARVTVNGAVLFQYARLHQEPVSRTFYVPADRTTFLVPPEPPQPRPREVPLALVPRDRRA